MSFNLLLVQDDCSAATVIYQALSSSKESFHVEQFRSRADGLARLGVLGEDGSPGIDAVLVDLFLPDSEGLATFGPLFAAAPQIPFLVLCNEDDEGTAKLAVQSGAQDYLLKSRVDDYLLPKALSNMVQRASIAEALFIEKERAEVTLNSIGDAVVTTDASSNVLYLNAMAERMTGWSRQAALGRPIGEVVRAVNRVTREPPPDPTAEAIRTNKIAHLPSECVLIPRTGEEASIEDSVAPIHDRRGNVLGAVMVFHDVSITHALTKQMAYLAQHDALTELPNRVLFSDRLSQAMAMAGRRRNKVSLLYLDLDCFKHINDSYGHGVGDLLLCGVAKRLTSCVRASDTVSRQGGDEFVILLADTTQAKDAAVAADKILVALRGPHYIEQHELHTTASIGIVTYPDDGGDAQTLMRHADSAMYQAKNAGRDSYQFYLPEMNVRALERQSLERDLRFAVQKNQFVLHYQPRLDLATNTIVGAEALIRWSHPRRGAVPPATFIPIAEESGLIVAIGRWVLQEACAQARAWQDAGLPPLRMAINVSAVQLRSKDFVSEVRSTLSDSGLDPAWVELELTETFLMQDAQATAGVLCSLKDLGVHLALDDFGTGYSSLSYLRRFPIDTLKIDQSFIRDLTTDADDASIVCAVIGMGKSLRMQVVAEGVETFEQLTFLREQICPEAQGYYFSCPVAAAAFANVVKLGVTGAPSIGTTYSQRPCA